MTKQLIVMGKDNLNNSLLASYIETNTSYPCYVVDINQQNRFQKDEIELGNLLLLDCNNMLDDQVDNFLEKCTSLVASDTHIALFNTSENNNTEHFAQNAAVKGIFADDVCHQQFICGIKSIFDGELWLSRRLISRLLIKNRKNPRPQIEYYGLTRREIEIIKLVAIGSRNNDIADILCLSPHTVKTHIYHIYKKLNVDNRMQAANWANLQWNTSS